MKPALRTILIILTVLACGLINRPPAGPAEPDWPALEQQAQDLDRAEFNQSEQE